MNAARRSLSTPNSGRREEVSLEVEKLGLLPQLSLEMCARWTALRSAWPMARSWDWRENQVAEVYAWKRLIYLSGRMRYVEGKVSLDGENFPSGTVDAMNAFRYKRSRLSPVQR